MSNSSVGLGTSQRQKSLKILLIGESCLDEYHYGECRRLSPEAPVPVLDGGQILFYLIEGIRGRPLSPRIREYALQIGVLFLVLLMLMVLFFDTDLIFFHIFRLF